jgi:hypothetical protein
MAVIVSNEQKQWNPIRKKMMPWIDMKKLAKTYGDSSCTIM